MPPKSKNQEDLIKRRLAQKICKRRRYVEIKNDPELLELEKRKRRERYQNKKKQEVNKKKSSRALKEQRKKWRENSKRYRQRKKEETGSGKKPPLQVVNVQAAEDDNNSNHTDTEEPGLLQYDPLPDYSQQIQAAVRKVRYLELKKRKHLLRIIDAYKKKHKSQRKHIQRLKIKLTEIQSTRTPVACNSDINVPESENDGIEERDIPVIERVKNFYLDDTNSVISACKKEYITRNRVRMQKRYLCLPLKDLYKKLRSELNLNVSYSFFCKLRPFWVRFPKDVNRETCACTLHVNMELFITALNKATILKEKNCDQVLSKLCCDSRNINCLQRQCAACSSKRLDYNNDQENKDIYLTYFKWVKVTKDVLLKDGRKKKQAITEKQNITISSREAIAKMDKDLIIFLQHTYKIIGQYKTIKKLKENLNIKEALIHVDFSENYSLKYAKEVQPFHFGGSRQQVSLHTAVLYTHSFDTGLVTPTSMCTLSDCLRHDAPAIWAHLIPLIEEVIKLNPLIDTLHFLSDAPSSQYRNKTMFHIISQINVDFPEIKRITWNYSESGHGKGAPDGVGATLKRTADRMVLYGKDVGTFNQFYDLIKECIETEQLSIIVKKVEERDIILKSNLIPYNIKPFKGTYSVHQVLWDKSEMKMYLRTMSCFQCSQICVHGYHLGNIVNVQSVSQNANVLTDITQKIANIQEFQLKPSTSKDNYNY